MITLDPVVRECVEEMREKLGHPGIAQERDKIVKKLEEASYNPGDVGVMADCILAVLLAARSQGFAPQTVFESLEARCKELKGRDWKQMPDGTFQAI